MIFKKSACFYIRQELGDCTTVTYEFLQDKNILRDLLRIGHLINLFC